RYYMAEGAGHYGIFNGSRWRTKVAPVVEEWIAAHGGYALRGVTPCHPERQRGNRKDPQRR
ncbi:MAG: hypothetical protein ACKO1O_02500, partial [Erythrobacter sp.]